MWVIDANGDGRHDMMLTHVDEQARLFLTSSSDTNHRIGFRLVGTSCSRDAIGAVVRFDAGGRKRTLWCLAGHGYLCANEQVLRAGLGKADRVENVTVQWPDGRIDAYGALEVDRQYLLVQGDDQAVMTRNYDESH
jgi:hypothetical protein